MDCDDAVGRIFNVGSGEEITIESLADKVISLTDSHSTKRFIPYEEAYGRPIEDMMRRVPSTERIRQTIGWQPQTDLTGTLNAIIESFRAEAPS